MIHTAQSSLPRSFSVANYRSFAELQTIEMRPLTLFFGWNSGGKSALVRFLPLISETARAQGPALNLAGDVARGSTWTDVVCRATQDHRLQFALEWDAGNIHDSAKWTVLGDPAGRFLMVQELKVACGSKPLILGASVEHWRGLLPEDASDEVSVGMGLDSPSLGTIRRYLKDLELGTQWISGVRSRPPRHHAFGGGLLPLLRSDGNNAVDFIISSWIQTQEQRLFRAVASFFEALGENLVIEELSAGLFRLALAPSSAPHVRVNLIDTGEGYSQVLPVLVALARAGIGGPSLVCVEQPELHLHTRAQRILADHLVTAIRQDTTQKILIETHSEVLLTSIQLAIARGDLKHEHVRIYWIEPNRAGVSRAIPVDLDELGRPTTATMFSAFEDVTRLGRMLLEQRRRFR